MKSPENTPSRKAVRPNRVRKCFTTRNNLNKRFSAWNLNGENMWGAHRVVEASIGISFEVDDYRHFPHFLSTHIYIHYLLLMLFPFHLFSTHIAHWLLPFYFSIQPFLLRVAAWFHPLSSWVWERKRVWDEIAKSRRRLVCDWGGGGEQKSRSEQEEGKKREGEKKSFSVFARASFIIFFLLFRILAHWIDFSTIPKNSDSELERCCVT